MKDVAEQNRIAPDTYRRWERGEREPGIESLIRIANYYCVSLDYLMGRYEVTSEKKTDK